MADTLPFIPVEQSYDPDMLHVMGAVFDMVHGQQSSLAPERVAHVIMDVARKDMDADHLRVAVLEHLRNSL